MTLTASRRRRNGCPRHACRPRASGRRSVSVLVSGSATHQHAAHSTDWPRCEPNRTGVAKHRGALGAVRRVHNHRCGPRTRAAIQCAFIITVAVEGSELHDGMETNQTQLVRLQATLRWKRIKRNLFVCLQATSHSACCSFSSHSAHREVPTGLHHRGSQPPADRARRAIGNHCKLPHTRVASELRSVVVAAYRHRCAPASERACGRSALRQKTTQFGTVETERKAEK